MNNRNELFQYHLQKQQQVISMDKCRKCSVGMSRKSNINRVKTLPNKTESSKFNKSLQIPVAQQKKRYVKQCVKRETTTHQLPAEQELTEETIPEEKCEKCNKELKLFNQECPYCTMRLERITDWLQNVEDPHHSNQEESHRIEENSLNEATTSQQNRSQPIINSGETQWPIFQLMTGCYLGMNPMFCPMLNTMGNQYMGIVYPANYGYH